MGEWLQKIIAPLKAVFEKLGAKQKIIIGAAAGVILVIFIVAVSSSGSPSYNYLFQRPLSPEDYARITKKLQEYGAEFKTKEDRYVLVKDEAAGASLRMRLGQDNVLPQDIKGWELFDTEKWTTTDFERNVMKRRAIIGAMTKHLTMLEDVEDATLTVSMPEGSLYMASDDPWKASVTIVAKPFSDIYKNEKKIKGIIRLVVNGIDKLKEENVVVTDNQGNILSDFSAEEATDYLVRTREEYKIAEKLRADLENKLRVQLGKALGADRFDLSIKYELDFDQTTVKKSEIIPIVMQEQDPEAAYNTREVVLAAATSTKKTKEEFKGPTYIPEGPAGTENNIPPGLKEKINRFSQYNKDETIENNEYSRKEENTKKAPYTIKRIGVAAWIDGVWKKVYKDGALVITEENAIKREYVPASDAELRTVNDILKSAMAFSAARGDQVVVRHLQYDRRAEQEQEDEEYRAKERLRKILLLSVGALFLIFAGTIAYRVISKELARRRRIREEELALQQQRLREQALRSAEEEGVEVELSLEEKARLEMQENAVNMARERPEDVAALIRTWLLEE